jgi:hypothetical protein
MRALGLAYQVQQPLLDRGVEGDHLHTRDLFGLAIVIHLLGRLEVDDVEVVHIVLRRA